MKRAAKKKSWAKMTAKELAEATKQFDKPTRFADTKPLTPAQRARWERAHRGTIYSVNVYSGKQRTIRLRIDESLLEEFDKFAERNHMTRDELITRSFRSAIAFAE